MDYREMMLTYAENFGRIEGVIRCVEKRLLTDKEALLQIKEITDTMDFSKEVKNG